MGSKKDLTVCPLERKPVSARASVWIYRIVKGKVVEGWNVDDELDFLKQLGVIEYKGFPDENVS